MKKKGDIKKHFKDAKTVFLPGKINRTTILLFFLLSNLFSQTVINNFGNSEFINTYSGYSAFSIIDFNKDGENDLFLYGNQSKNFVLHLGLADSSFSKPIRKFFFYPIDDFKWLTKSKNGDDYYIFISRNKRLAGLVSFTRSYSLRLLNTIEFNSYPSFIKIVDLDYNGINEALVFGTNFNGIHHIKNNGYRLESTVLHEEKVFSDLLLTDFNQDDLDDIIVTDVLQNSISFLENTEFNGFVPVREIEFEKNLISLSPIDYDQNEFSDLLVAKENGFEILLGDSVYSYDNRLDLSTSYSPSLFLVDDFYKDSNFDLAVINSVEDKLILYSDFIHNENSIQIDFQGISDIKVDSNYNGKSLISLSNNGKILELSNSRYAQEAFSFNIGGLPTNLDYLSLADSSHSLLYVNNNLESSIDILHFDSSNSIVQLEKLSLQNSFGDFEISNRGKIISAFNKGNRLVEIISKVPNTKNLSNTDFVYSAYPVEDLMIDNNNQIQIVELFENELFHESIEKINNRYAGKEIFSLDTQVVTAKIIDYDKIYYWTKNNDEFNFKKSVNGDITSLINYIKPDTLVRHLTISKDEYKNSELVTIVSEEDKDYLYLIDADEVYQYYFEDNFRIQNATHNFIKYFKTSDFGRLIFFYNEQLQILSIYKFDSQKYLTVPYKIIEGIELIDYFVQSFNNRMYLIYSDKNKRHLSFRIFNE